MERNVKTAFAKEIVKGFKVEIAAVSAVLLGIGAAIGYVVAKRQA